MSYTNGLRKPLRNRSQLVSSGRYMKKLKTKRGKPKPVWDDSVNDLTVHKPSPQELQRNHELHQPKKDHERLFGRIESSSNDFFHDTTDDNSFYCQDRRNTPARARRKDVLLKQGFYNQERELDDLLSETDKTLAEVKDMFGDDIYKYKSIPVFTKAPNFTGDFAHSNISVMNPANPSYYDTLSESVVRQLNASSLTDEEESSSIDSDTEGHVRTNEDLAHGKEHTQHNNTAFQPKVNVGHYQNVLSQNSMEAHQGSSVIDVPDIESLTKELTKSIKGSNGKNDCNSQAQNNPGMSTTSSIENKKTSRTNATTTALQTFDDMKKMLDSLESEIVEYEKETGKENISKSFEIPSSITGYTANLLSVIIRLTRHLKQSEIQLKAEMAMRSEILDMFDDQRKLVDVLTSNVMELEVSNDSLKKELHSQRIACQTNHAKLKNKFENLETRFNLAISNGDQRIHPQRKPLGNMTNTHAISWTEN